MGRRRDWLGFDLLAFQWLHSEVGWRRRCIRARSARRAPGSAGGQAAWQLPGPHAPGMHRLRPTPGRVSNPAAAPRVYRSRKRKVNRSSNGRPFRCDERTILQKPGRARELPRRGARIASRSCAGPRGRTAQGRPARAPAGKDVQGPLQVRTTCRNAQGTAHAKRFGIIQDRGSEGGVWPCKPRHLVAL